MFFNVSSDWLAWRVEGLDAFVTFTEGGDSGPVGGSAAHAVEAGSSQLIGGVWLETCTDWSSSLFIQNTDR